MKRIFAMAILLLLLLTSCNTVGTDGETSADTGESTTEETVETSAEVTTEESDPWYLSKQADYELFRYEIGEEYRNRVIRLQATYEFSLEGLDVKIELFKEEYRADEPIQTRVTVTNNTEEDLTYAAHIPFVHIRNGTTGGNLSSQPLTLAEVSLEDIGDPRIEAIRVGESVTVERVIVMSELFLSLEERYSLRFCLLEKRDGLNEWNEYEKEFPIEVIEISSDSEP